MSSSHGILNTASTAGGGTGGGSGGAPLSSRPSPIPTTTSGGRSSNSAELAASALFTRQATILRKNMLEWNRIVRGHGEDWPRMLGRANAALNQCMTLDQAIDDVLEHFQYVPRQATANPGDIPFFLSTRLDSNSGDAVVEDDKDTAALEGTLGDNPVQQLAEFESSAARLVRDYESKMIRF